jgi:hypothetical protein
VTVVAIPTATTELFTAMIKDGRGTAWNAEVVMV